MQNQIYPCLWFDGNAKEAASFYCSVFNNSIITDENSMVVVFESSGQKFMCLNGGPYFTINPSISFMVAYESEQELEKNWKLLSKDGSVLMPLDKYSWSPMYGWIQDKFGVSWQLFLGSPHKAGQKFYTTLMFSGHRNGQAEKAIRFYTSVFNDSSVDMLQRYSSGENEIEGAVLHGQFSLNGQVFMAMDSHIRHEFGFNEAISLVVECFDQREIDYYWEKLSAGGEEGQCGWLKDKFGISWQIVPEILGRLVSDPERSERVINAFMQMKKFDIEKLVNA